MNVLFTRVKHLNVCCCVCVCQFCAQNLLLEDILKHNDTAEHNYLHLNIVFVFFSPTYQCNMKKVNFCKTRLVFKFQWFMKNISTIEQKKIKL